MFRSLVLATLVSITAASGAFALDKLVQRDMDAFASFVRVRVESLEAAIARKDVGEARNLAGRIHEEECRFLERVCRYLRDAKNYGTASELEGYLEAYRQLSLKDTVRVRRQAGPGRVPMAELAYAALTGTRVAMSTFALPPSGLPQAPVAEPPPGPPPGFVPQPPIGTQVPSLPAQSTTAFNQRRYGASTLKVLNSDLSDQAPLLAQTRSKSVNLDTLRSHTGSGIGGSPLPATSVLEGADDGALASSIRVPGGATSQTPAKAPVASSIRVPNQSRAQLPLPVGLRR